MAMDSSNRLTFHRKLFTGLVVYSVILVACFASYQYMREKAFKVSELNAQLQIVNDRIFKKLSDGVPVGEIVIPSQFPDMRISVIDRHGKLIYDNSHDSLPGSDHSGRKEIADAMRNGEGFSIRRHSESTGLTYFYSAKSDGEYIVRTAVPYSVSLMQLLSADYGFLWVMVGITAAMCVVGYFATHRIGVNIERLRQFTRKAEKGEKIYDTEPFPHDELGDISSHVVRLYARLQQALADRDREHRAALREEREKIRIKRQLTNNINHELKTPVASMQVCLETLLEHEDIPADKRREFLQRCYSANIRLRRLLDDVAMVTRLEDGGESIAREPVDVGEIVAEVEEEFFEEAHGKGMAIVTHMDSGFIVSGNQTLIYSIFRNLMSNAIAYSGASEVEVCGRRTGDRLCVIFQDNGTGVPEEHLPHLFERFYRIDKGRSRNLGGTGLGLAIVKNGVVWHGGSISVDNRPEGGLRFTFTLGTILDNAAAADETLS